MNGFNQLLNVSEKEWPRILLAWSLTFLSRIGFIVGWTILIASFMSRVGITYLPLLFLVNAIFVILGTLIYRHVIHAIKREVLISFTVLLGAAFMLAAAGLMNHSSELFFFLFLLAQGVFIGQLGILINLFNEDLFSPLESQRTFPIIESAETIGGIMAGILLTTFSHELPPYKFILLGVLLLLAVLPIVLKYNRDTLEIPHLAETKHHHSKPLKENFQNLKKIPFIKGMMVVVLLHFAMMNVIEFQSMKALQQNVYHEEEKTIVLEDNPSVILSEENKPETSPKQEDVHEENLTQKLGLLHIVFYSGALLLQLVFASRILSNLGIVPSMMLHPIIIMLNTIVASLRFNIFTASITRGSFELTSVLFKNAFESSYYAIEHSLEVDTKEVILGIVRPIGAILGTSGMMVAALLLNELQETLALSAIVLLGSVAMLLTLKTLSKKYSELCEHNLSHKQNLPTRLNAIEILGQKGHEKDFPALEKLLKRPQEPLVVKETILKTLGLREDMQSIGVILEMLENKEERLRHAAIAALEEFKDLKEHLMKQAFTRHRVIEALKEILLKEESNAVRESVVQCFYKIAPEELTSFILECIEKQSDKKAAFIQMLKLFPDPNLGYYVKPYLEDNKPEVRAAAIVALWQFQELSGTLKHHLSQLLKSPHIEIKKIGIKTAGTVLWEESRSELIAALQNPDPSIQHEAILALAQLEDSSILPTFIEKLSNPLHEWFERSSILISALPKHFQEETRYLLHMRFVEQIHDLFKVHKGRALNEWSREALRELQKLYGKLSAHEEVHQIQNVLDRTD